MLDNQKIDNLEFLGRVWGFLKYHHPQIAEGNYNWDYELFRFLPTYIAVETAKERDEILLQWISKLDTISNCNSYEESTEQTFLKPNLSWIENSNIDSSLKELLMNIYQKRCQGNQYYVQINAGGRLVFSNENDCKQFSYPDSGFRLLALYRYWNIIHYFFPYKYLTDKDWDTILKEYIPLIINTANELEYELIITRLVGEVCDSHAGLWAGGDKIDSLRGNMQMPVQLRFIENKWVVTDYYMNPIITGVEKIEKTGLEIGDIITHINRKPIEQIVDSVKAYYPASNYAARMRDIAGDLLRSNEHSMHITYLSFNKLKKKEVALEKRPDLYPYIYKKDTARCYRFINENIGYITLKTIKEADIPIIKKEFVNTKGIIIDIRNYPSYFVPFLLGSYFVSDKTPFVKFTEGNLNNPGEFTYTHPLEISKSEESYHGKLVVIVNEDTQSQAEYTAMAFRAGKNTTIIGSTTAGADGDVVEIRLPGGLMTWISSLGVYYPNGTETQRIGIVPDIEVKPTIKGIMEGRDELLEKAIGVITAD